MFSMDRRSFLSSLAGSMFTAEIVSAVPQSNAPIAGTCWLDVAAPFIVVDPVQQLSTELLLTATCFPGIDGYKNSQYATEYQILLFDASGKEIKLDNAGRLSIPALRPTLLSMKELSGRDAFVGGAKVRVAPSPHQVPRAGDLFSAGFDGDSRFGESGGHGCRGLQQLNPDVAQFFRLIDFDHRRVPEHSFVRAADRKRIVLPLHVQAGERLGRFRILFLKALISRTHGGGGRCSPSDECRDVAGQAVVDDVIRR